MDVGGKLREIESIDKELSNMKLKRKTLNDRRKALLDDLIAYHKSRDIESFEYRGKKYHIHDATIAKRKKKEQRERDVLAALEAQHGLYGDDAKSVYRSVLQHIKGISETKPVLKTK